MDRTSHYLLKNFSSLFASLFFTLFFITSIVFFIKIASITAVIKINFIELGMMYIYLLPQILIYTLPITFFIGVCIALFNLSKENETIVLFTLGYEPKKIARFFSVVAAILSIILIIDFLILIPIAKQLQRNFFDYKRIEAKFNIKATEFGQKFSNWFVYINTIDEDENYKDVVMYQPIRYKESQKIITSKNAKIENEKGILKLNLNNGKVFQVNENNINQVVFNNMQIRSFAKEFINPVIDVKTYWLEYKKAEGPQAAQLKTFRKRKTDFVFFSLLALFPLGTILFAISIGIVTYRYEKSNIYPKIFIVAAFYIGSIPIIVKYLDFYTIPLVFGTSFILSYIAYLKKIKQRY